MKKLLTLLLSLFLLFSCWESKVETEIKEELNTEVIENEAEVDSMSGEVVEEEIIENTSTWEVVTEEIEKWDFYRIVKEWNSDILYITYKWEEKEIQKSELNYTNINLNDEVLSYYGSNTDWSIKIYDLEEDKEIYSVFAWTHDKNKKYAYTCEEYGMEYWTLENK